jgi:hypothetical protein
MLAYDIARRLDDLVQLTGGQVAWWDETRDVGSLWVEIVVTIAQCPPSTAVEWCTVSRGVSP